MDARIIVTDQKAEGLRIEREILSGADVSHHQVHSADEFLETVNDVDAIITDGYAEVSQEVLEQFQSLAVVARAGIGVDNIDVDAATERGIQVVNVPSYCANEVAGHSLALMLSCIRNITRYDSTVRQGAWDWEQGAPVHRIAGTTLGLVGFGDIAREVATQARGFEMDVLACAPNTTAAEMAELGVEKVSFDTLLERSNIVSLHVPLTEKTNGMLDRDAFRQMRDDAILVNSSRGRVVVEADLVNALEAGELLRAGLDVLPTEPPENSSLLERDDVVLTPHVGWYSEEGITEVRRRAAEDVKRVLHGTTPRDPVNAVQNAVSKTD